MTILFLVPGRATRRVAPRRGHGRMRRGFTLIELMMVLAVIGVLTAMTAARVSKTRHARSVHDFAAILASASDTARLRAIATRRWQRLYIEETDVSVWQAAEPGMRAPESWTLVRRLSAPERVRVVAADARVHIAADDDVPEGTSGVPAVVDFGPDGTGTAATLFVGDDRDHDRARLVIYRATGTAYVMDSW